MKKILFSLFALVLTFGLFNNVSAQLIQPGVDSPSNLSNPINNPIKVSSANEMSEMGINLNDISNISDFSNFDGIPFDRLGMFIAALIGILVFMVPLILFIIVACRKRPESTDFCGFWKRISVATVDGIIISIFSIVPFLIILPIGVNIYLYFAKGRTIGDYVMKTKLVDAKTGQKPSAGKLIGRFFAKILSSIGLLGYFWAGWTKEKTAWHDSLSGVRYKETVQYSGGLTFFINIAPFILMILSLIMFIVVNILKLGMTGFELL